MEVPVEMVGGLREGRGRENSAHLIIALKVEIMGIYEFGLHDGE